MDLKIGFFLMLMISLASASWWNNSFNNRFYINVTNPNTDFNNFVMNVSVDTQDLITRGKMRSDCGDIRFTYKNQTDEIETGYHLYGGTGYYNSTQSGCNTNTTAFYVWLPYQVKFGNTTQIGVYYNSPTSTNKSSFNSTYYLWEDFSGTNGAGSSFFNSSRLIFGTTFSSWGTSCSVGLTCAYESPNWGHLTLSSAGTSWQMALNINVANKTVIWRHRLSSGVSTSAGFKLSNTTSNSSGSSAWTGWSQGSINDNPAASMRLNVNTTGGFLYKNNVIDPYTRETGAQDPWNRKSNNGTMWLTWFAGNDASELFISNISVVSYSNIPLGQIKNAEEASSDITVAAYDETTNLQIYFNATFDNTTSTFSFPTTFSYNANSSVFPQGINTVTFRNASYYSRNQIITISNTSQTINGYLLPLGYANAISVNFHINGISGAPLSGATVTIQKSISSTYTTIAQCLTDDSGTCNFVLDNTVTYQIIASASGYDTKTVLINPVGSDYTITLSGFSSAGSFNGDSNGIVLTLLPGQLDLIKNWTIINYTVNDSLANLALFGLNISYGASQIYSFTNTTSITGGQILVNISTVGRVGNFTVYYFYQKVGGGGNMLHHVYYIFQNFSNPAWSLSNTFDNLRVSGASPFFTGTIIIVTTSIVVGAVNSNMALGVGTGFLAVGVIAFLMPIIAKDYTSGLFIALLLIVAVAMVRLRTVN